MGFVTNRGFTSTPVGDEQITLGAGATPLTPAAANPDANACIIHVEAQAVRWRDNGGAPTAAIGQKLLPDAYFEYVGDLSKLQFIRLGAGAILNVSYYQVSPL